VNFLSFDVEEWFHSSNFDGVVHPDEWNQRAGRVSRNVARILEVLADVRVTATFFVLGWVAERFPAVVREIVSAGHEIGAHGYGHRLIHTQSSDEFREDVVACLEHLARAGAPSVVGYRAPSYSITRTTLWALDVLSDLGFHYDSSVYPVRFHHRYGISDARREPHLIRPTLAEFPLPAIHLAGISVPVATGAYFRLFPYQATRAAIQHLNRNGVPVTVNLHPWELDPDQPYVRLPWALGFRHYTNLQKTEARLRQLLVDFEFHEIAAGLPVLFKTDGSVSLRNSAL
jgi:polysaccharide deacetylase family protein (PEP-CTERM system associated)